MPITVERIRHDIEAIARFSETPGGGASRPTFAQAWRQARVYVIDQAKGAGRAIRIDASGNCHARPASPAGHRGFSEVHIEQGPAMWKRNERFAIVRAIAGRRQYRCTLFGVANHAGSTPMNDRHDALVGAATLILQFEGLARGLSPETVMTVGRIQCEPNAVNVIASKVEFALDFRSPANEILTDGQARIEEQVKSVCSRRGLKYE